MTEDQIAQITQMATSDSRVQQILGGQPYTVGGVATWTKYGGADLIGGELELDLAGPTTISGSWPDFVYNEAENTDPVYQTGVVSYTASNVTSLHVFVDLNCNTVVGVRPDAESVMDDSTFALDSGPVQPPGCGDPPTNKTWTRNVREIYIGGDAFWNYDFHHKDITEDFRTNANDPINLIFWGAFALDKSQLQKYSVTPGGGTENAFIYLNGGGGWSWDSDRGSKDKLTCGSDTHYRLYGHPHDMPAPNAKLGYFYIGGAHHDIADLPDICGWLGHSTTYGWYEDAERHLARYFNSLFGFAAKVDAMWVGNPEGTHTLRHGYWDGNHWRSNDGYATMIHACINGSGESAPCT